MEQIGYALIQKHTVYELIRIVSGVLVILLIIPIWVWVLKHGDDRNE